MGLPRLDGKPIVFASEAFLRLPGYAMHEVPGPQPHFMSGAGTDTRRAKTTPSERIGSLISKINSEKS